MNKIGKIGAYDQATGKGIILIKDSVEKVEFTIAEWIDTEKLPSFDTLVEITKEGIKTFIEEVEVVQEFIEISFTELRNRLYNEFKNAYSIFEITSDKVDSFFIKSRVYNKYLHLKKDEDGNVSLDLFNLDFSESFFDDLKKYNLSVKNTVDGDTTVINESIQNTKTVKEENNESLSQRENKVDNNNQTLGIIAFVLSIVGIFAIPIIMQPVALIMGIMSKNIFGKVAIAIAGIHLAIMLIALVLGVSLAMH